MTVMTMITPSCTCVQGGYHQGFMWGRKLHRSLSKSLLLIAATYSSLIITFQNSQLCDASRKDDVVRVASLLNLGAELNGVEKVSFFL